MRDLPSSCDSMEDLEATVQLEPFAHQVGGHTCMLRYDDSSVCKPRIHREQHFYQIMPQELKAFTPQFRGVVEVFVEKDSEGYTRMTAVPQRQHNSLSNSVLARRLSIGKSQCGKSRSVPNLVPGSSSPSSGGDTAQSDSDSEGSEGAFRPVTAISRRRVPSPPDGSSGSSSPWCMRLHREQLAKMQNKAHSFIVLENLAAQFQLPCILDLKMGTRQHGDDATDAKRMSQMLKCQKTTSSALGMRLCGMKVSSWVTFDLMFIPLLSQVYKEDSGRYVCRDKYFGRGLDKNGFLDCLNTFLNNGHRLRQELIRPILRRLRQLRQVISHQNTFRFYSSSLLIMYEGFAGESGRCGHDACDLSEACPSCSRVDVRMIDFAHVTHQGFRGDRTVHNGPDGGYLLGLNNLIVFFEQLTAHCSASPSSEQHH